MSDKQILEIVFAELPFSDQEKLEINKFIDSNDDLESVSLTLLGVVKTGLDKAEEKFLDSEKVALTEKINHRHVEAKNDYLFEQEFDRDYEREYGDFFKEMDGLTEIENRLDKRSGEIEKEVSDKVSEVLSKVLNRMDERQLQNVRNKLTAEKE